MLLASFYQVPLILLLPCFSDGKAHHFYRSTKVAPNYDVLAGANFPDPSIVNVQGISYVFATTDGIGHNIPTVSNRHFNDGSSWSGLNEAFPVVGVPAYGPGGWAVPFTSWAPDVQHLTDYDGSFAMYYSPALQSNDTIHCVGLARSALPTGPYNDSSTAPMICPVDAGGAIDASGYLDDDNKRYVVYKIDGPSINNGGYCNSPSNPPSLNTSLMLQEVQNDAYTLVGSPKVLYNNDGVADKYNIEAPVIVKSDDTYFLFFSSGCTSDNSYTVSYVTSVNGIWGPYGKRKVLLKTGDFGEYGPGGADIDQATGDMVYHSLKVSDNITDGRVLNTAKVTLAGRKATIP